MKTRRQELILRLIKEYAIETQEELARLVKENGVETTQATISRDLRELDIEKVIDRDGCSRYAVVTRAQPNSSAKFAKILAQTVQNVDYACNLVVVKTMTGMGNAAGAAVDSMGWEDIVGTIAGDDTLLVVTRSENKAEDICGRLKELIS